MTTDLFPRTRELIAKSAFGQLPEFCAWLEAERYTPLSIHKHVLRLEQALPRLPAARRKMPLHVDDLKVLFDGSHGPLSRRNGILSTLRAYRRFLRVHGRLSGDTASDRFAALRDGYECHLRELRGLSASTLQHHAMTVTAFLTHALGPRRPLDSLARRDVEDFIALRSERLSRHSMQHVVAQLRSFLRYCHDHGHIGIALDVIDTPRTYRGELPPQALPWVTVLALLRSIDHRSKAGWRDHCILHLLAHYGLRPVEVVALHLGSIDWEAGVLHVTQSKTRTALLLPLAPPTLQLLRRYLAHDRNQQDTCDTALFLRARCPDGPLYRWGVCDIFDKRMRVANLAGEGRRPHVYCLRHTFAMRLLTRGVGVKAIGDLLGHRSLQSTCAYLRLDIDMLRGVALDVPSMTYRGGGLHA